MDKKTVALTLLAVALVVPAVASPGVMAQESGNESNVTIQEGPYSLEELRGTGTSQNIEGAGSVRSLGDPPMGFVGFRYRNPTLLDAIQGDPGAWAEITTDRTVRQNTIQVYASAFGELTGEYTLEIVYWQTAQKQVGNTTVTYAANQTVEQKTFSINEDERYSRQNISLIPHTDQTYRVTMWLERNGEKVDGAQWRYFHRSNPASASVSINSATGAWGFTLRNGILPGIASVIAGLVGAKGTLKLTGRGPGYGLSAWMSLVVFVGLIISLIAYYQIAVILTNLPWVMGLGIGVIAYAAGLTFHQPARQIGFFRRELEDANIIPGGGKTAENDASISDGGAELFDELSEALYADLPEVPAVRTEDGYRVPVTGMMPFIARIFADAALLDVSGIATRMKIDEGRLDDIIITDPGVEEALEHKSATLKRVLPWDTLDEDASLSQEVWAALFTTGIILVPPFGAMTALDRAVNLPVVGFILGVFVTVAIAYSAEDGWIDFRPAPPHYERAENNLTALQRAYKNAAEDQMGKREAWEERAKTAQEAREERADEHETVTEKLMGSLGASQEDDR